MLDFTAEILFCFCLQVIKLSDFGSGVTVGVATHYGADQDFILQYFSQRFRKHNIEYFHSLKTNTLILGLLSTTEHSQFLEDFWDMTLWQMYSVR